MCVFVRDELPVIGDTGPRESGSRGESAVCLMTGGVGEASGLGAPEPCGRAAWPRVPSPQEVAGWGSERQSGRVFSEFWGASC